MLRVTGYGAAGLTMLWALVHIGAGGAEAIPPLLASDLALQTKATNWIVFQLMSVLLVGMAGLYAWGTYAVRRDVLATVTVLTGLMCLAGIVLPWLAGMSWMLMPQGFLFLPVAVMGGLAAWAARRVDDAPGSV